MRKLSRSFRLSISCPLSLSVSISLYLSLSPGPLSVCISVSLSLFWSSSSVSLFVPLPLCLSRILTAISHLLVSSDIHAMIYCFILDTNPSMAETTPAQPISALDMCKSAIEQFLLKLRATGAHSQSHERSLILMKTGERESSDGQNNSC
jgi:hypothetical protein